MYRLKESIHVNAPIDRCFLLATSIEIVAQTIGMAPVAGQTSGLVVHGSRLTWRGRKFGLPAFHETLITAYDRPAFFQDSMARGMFREFQHDHRFQDIDGHTLLIEVVRFSLPFGPLGKVIAKRIVIPHILDTIQKRFQLLKRIAEGSDWERYLAAPGESSAASPLADQLSSIQHP